MKLKCDKHARRVHVLESSNVVHRQDGSKCDAVTVEIGGRGYFPTDIANDFHTWRDPYDYWAASWAEREDWVEDLSRWQREELAYIVDLAQ